MSELSPEPWVVDEGGHYVVDGKGEVICTMDKLEIVEGRWCPSAETLDNADLFAAAPETKRLLAELVAAAEPFAAVGREISDEIKDDSGVLITRLEQKDGEVHTVIETVSTGHLRALAAAVAATKGE